MRRRRRRRRRRWRRRWRKMATLERRSENLRTAILRERRRQNLKKGVRSASQR
jgi:hypothetical protein